MYHHYQKSLVIKKYMWEDYPKSSFYVQHHSSKRLKSVFVCLQHPLKISLALPQMAINFNFLPKSTFYTAFPRHRVLLSFLQRQRLKKKKRRKRTKGQIKAICSVITVGGSVDHRCTPLPFSFLSTQHQYHIEKQTSERISGETPLCAITL